MKYLALLFVLVLAGCSPEPTQSLVIPVQSEHGGARFTVERVGVFQDMLAYNSHRGIYLIIDTETGKEYVGVSGIGISETGFANKQSIEP